MAAPTPVTGQPVPGQLAPGQAIPGQATTAPVAGASNARETTVVTWPLAHAVPGAPRSLALEYKNDQGDSVSDPDLRRIVDRVDYGPGGKYRSVVKLFCLYARQDKSPDTPWAMGTGWLIGDDLIATAGHNSYDWRYGFGPVERVKAYIGYEGKQTLNNPNVQFRTVTQVATTVGWLTSRENKCNNMSIMKVDPPFTGVTPIKFSNTPFKGDEVLGVVGYPGDKQNAMTGEFGDRMWQEFIRCSYDRNQSGDNMLEYAISTFGGNSGSPVFQRKEMTSIGVHVYGGEVNSASCIGDDANSNPFAAYISVFDTNAPANQVLISPTDIPQIPDPSPSMQFYKVTHDTSESE